MGCRWLHCRGPDATIGYRWNNRMRIVCPSCQAAYEVPDKLLGSSPRKVRCARCGGSWVPEPVAAPILQPPSEMPPPEAAPGGSHAGEAETPTGHAPEAGPQSPPLAAPAPLAAAVPLSGPAAKTPAPAPGAFADGRALVVVAGVLWLASLAALAGAVWAAFAFRHDIMALWAPSRRLYALLGLG